MYTRRMPKGASLCSTFGPKLVYHFSIGYPLLFSKLNSSSFADWIGTVKNQKSELFSMIEIFSQENFKPLSTSLLFGFSFYLATHQIQISTWVLNISETCKKRERLSFLVY
jgi:hypothetical protein